MRNRTVEIVVGLFVAAGIAALFMLAMQVSNLSAFNKQDTYLIDARFKSIGGLKVRSPVRIGGVRIGRVTNIEYDSENYEAIASMYIESRYDRLPVDTSATINTAGLLGEQYIGLEPGNAKQYLQEGGLIKKTRAALGLEQMIANFVNISTLHDEDGYKVYARFENIGGLKDRSPVRIAGVIVGHISAIEYDSNSYEALVTMLLDKQYNKLPEDTSAAILTSGLLGAQYIELEPGGAEEYLHEGSNVEETQSAIVLERLIGKFLFNGKDKK